VYILKEIMKNMLNIITVVFLIATFVIEKKIKNLILRKI